jgi:beta-glucosidase
MKEIKRDNRIINFPPDFFWGTSTSAYQIEGGIINDWSEYENDELRIKNYELRGLNPDDYACGRACDSYNRYEEDFDLAKSLNMNAVRFGIEWSRIEPEKGKFSMKEIEHYRKVIEAAKKRNLKIVLTLWHWTNPIWLAREGGWVNKKVVGYYAQYVKKIVEELGDSIDYWITLNEPMVHISNGYLTAKFPPAKRNILKAIKVWHNLIRAHKEAYAIIHKRYSKAHVSITQLTNYFEPARKWCLIEKGLVKLFHYFWNHRFLKKIENFLDYIAFDYYFHDRIVWHPPFRKNFNKKVTDMSWEIYPEGIYYVLKYLNTFHKPIFVMENGLADKDDKYRADFIKDHLYYIHKAIEEGVDVRGYFYWSLLDNFEWAEGWVPKFGLFEVDRKTFKRKVRPSAEVYSEICKNNKLIINKP